MNTEKIIYGIIITTHVYLNINRVHSTLNIYVNVGCNDSEFRVVEEQVLLLCMWCQVFTYRVRMYALF